MSKYNYGVVRDFLFVIEIFQCFVYDSIMSDEVDMNEQNESEAGANEEHVDCSDAFNTFQVFATRDDVLHWARSIAYEIGFVAVIMRLDINNDIRGRTSFVLIGWESSGQYRAKKKKDLVKTITDSRICGCPFKLRAKLLVVVGHLYVGRLTKDEKIIVADMTKSMVKPINILLTLKEHNANSYTTIKQIYNARNAYRSSIRDNNTEIQQLIKLLKQDQYIHWHRLNDEDVVHNTYKKNKYKLSLLDIVGVTPTGMTFSVAFVFIVTDRDLALMNEVKTVFPEAANLLCRFHIDKNVKAKCKTLQEFDECLKKFEIACSPWSMFVNQTWLIPLKERFVKAWTNKVMHLGNITNRIESTHWALKRLLQNSLGDLCSVWEAMNNMIMLQHTEIKASFETSTHLVGDVFKVTLYMRLLGIVSRYALNHIVAKFERVHCADKTLLIVNFEELDVCGKVTLKSKLREIAYLDLNSMCAPPEKVKTKVKRSASSSKQTIQRRTMRMLDQFHPCIHDSIENIVDVKADGNCGYHAIAALLGMGEDSWFLVCNHLLKELAKWSDEYINLLGGIERFEELKRSLLTDGLSMLYKDCCPLPPIALLWSTHYHHQAKQWPTPYISRTQQYTNLSRLKTNFVDLGED
ncbi:hypothetical protein HKD37_12G034298 [Glycine soja]